MRMGGARYANGRIMRALWGFGEIAEKTPKKMGCAAWGEISPKRRVSTKKEDQKKFQKFWFFLLTQLALGDNLIVPKGGKDLQK